VLVQGEHLQPGGEVLGQLHDGAPNPVLVKAVQREVGQAGVFSGPDTIFAAGPAAMA
jgi:hypothetical protein